MTKRIDKEDRRQQRLRRLGTQNPICLGCGESDSAVIEQHHIAGRKRSGDLVLVCATCHGKLSEEQRDHVAPESAKPLGQLGTIGHYLVGLADLLAMVAGALRGFGKWLLREASRGGRK